MAAAVAAMVEQTLESRVARLESDVSHIRSDITEVKIDIRELRSEVGSLRSDVQRLEKSLQTELHGLDTSFRAAIAELNQKLTGGLASNRIWMLLQSAAILGVIARGFKWL